MNSIEKSPQKGRSTASELWSSRPAHLPGVRALVQNVLPDVLDNRESEKPPRMAEQYGEGSRALLHRLLPADFQDAVRQKSTDYATGEQRLHRVLVGSRENGTAHPHDFWIEKTPDAMRVFFVDPENTVGHRNKFRPSITNLMAAEIPLAADGDQSARVAILRMRTGALEKQRKGSLKLQAQFEIAQTLLDNEGIPQVPDEGGAVSVAGNEVFANDILFRIYTNGEKSVTQGRYSGKRALARFALGQKGSQALEGKVQSHLGVLESFSQYLGETQEAFLAASSRS